MKKINLKPYEIEIVDVEKLQKEKKLAEKEGTVLTDVPMKTEDFDVKENLANIVFSIKHGGREYLKDCDLAHKIEDCKEDFILLETSEYKKIVSAVDKWENWQKNHEPFIRRIYDAKEVKVEESKKG